jgi:hypothetical protein
MRACIGCALGGTASAGSLAAVAQQVRSYQRRRQPSNALNT